MTLRGFTALRHLPEKYQIPAVGHISALLTPPVILLSLPVIVIAATLLSLAVTLLTRAVIRLPTVIHLTLVLLPTLPVQIGGGGFRRRVYLLRL